ncbi:MAG: hypothetical protein IKC09_08875 [Oscillospiraceae bacterium]|nr:hypothetical protein [Oscillospiraceae bacterium]
MTLQELLLGGGGGLLVLLTLIQISPIKINPWSMIARCLGRAINKDVLDKLQAVEDEQKNIKSEMAKQKAEADKREADGWRADILRFNMELVKHTKHTREDYIEILDIIDKYETYCDAHKDYENNRAVHAVANIERCYDDRLKNNDFA